MRDEVELLGLVARYRWQLGLERLVLFSVRGSVASGLALIALSAAAWLTEGRASETVVWLSGAPLLVAVVIAVVRWPSRRQAAMAADRRHDLQDRLTTAMELLHRHAKGRFDRLQIRDATERGFKKAKATQIGWLALDARARNQALLAVGVLALAAAELVLLPRLSRPVAPGSDAGLVTDATVTDEMAMRTLPEDAPGLALANTQSIQQAFADADLAARVQQEQSEGTALDTLARALGTVSAGQAAADAIEQGNFAEARDQLLSLGEEADQLSDAAKQQLAKALQQAASATAPLDRLLAERERQAAQALSRPSYSEQRQALRALADRVERSGARSVPADQLQRDVGRLQQQTGGAATNRATAPSGSASLPGGQTATLGPGVGSGSDPELFGDHTSRLDTVGQTVQVPTRLGNGPGVRPADHADDQATLDPSIPNRTISEQAQAQQTGQVAPEQNLVPGEQRPVVRGYFR